jgi:hypothetical protein
MAKTRSSKNIFAAISLAPLILVAITAALICITCSEIISYNQLKAKANESEVVDCAYIGEQAEAAARCKEESRQNDLVKELELQNYYSNVVILVAITILSAGLDVVYLSLARK